MPVDSERRAIRRRYQCAICRRQIVEGDIRWSYVTLEGDVRWTHDRCERPEAAR